MTDDKTRKIQEYAGSVAEILEFRARHTPDKSAYGMLDAVFRLTAITYAELWARVAALSSRLPAQIAGERCLLMFQPGIDFIVALLACSHSGAIPVPVNMPGRNKSLVKWENIAANCQACCILTDKAGLDTLPDILKPSGILAALPLYAEQAGIVAGTSPGFNELAFLQYTSGSTGDPKGVMVTHASLLNNLKQLADKFRINENSVMVSWLPFYHDMGLILGILQGIYSGNRVILMNPADFMQQPLNWLRAISVYQATHTAAPNFAYELAAAKLAKLSPDEAKDISLQSLTRAVCGAEPVNLNTMLKFNQAARPFGFREYTLAPGYGLAEASLVVSAYRPGQKTGWLKLARNDLQNGLVSVLDRGYLDYTQQPVEEAAAGAIYLVGNGFVIDGHQVSVRNPESGAELGSQVIGEICFAGESVTRGYWNRAEETNATFPVDEKTGWVFLRTGDLGFLDTNGELYITGRIKDLIIIRGMNYYPQDIERTAFTAHPDLRPDGTAAFSVVQAGEEQLILIQEVNRPAVRKPQCDQWAKQIRADILKVHGILAESIIFLPPMHVPRTTSGKIQRNKAKAMYLNREWDKIVGIFSLENSERAPGTQPITSREELADYITGLVARQLAVPAGEIDRSLPFTELGLNSMMTLSVRSSLEQAMGFSIPSVALFNYNTVQQMSEHLFSLKHGSVNQSCTVRQAGAGDSAVFPEAEYDHYSEEELLALLAKEVGGEDHAH
ncbi:AMP-dependent synthetase and ligase [uncultured Sporomusa sp.]|uniref:AMP-dependent synthetase and ligase n=1 Tax=uncultured Sporomusa sp. TaxID=307249 RepID=A0A212LVA9_9FIRM|nr:AMP-binding protein [uncultured Sporomusa sp.]SCM81452.1 AMP-dependent synthetase and ligase [uncultured Sporomusa sp.]